MKKTALTKLLAVGATLTALYGCSGDPAFSVNTLQLGSGIGNTFTDGAVTIDTTGTNPVIEVHLVDKDGLLSTQPVTINFSSACTATGAATITPASVVNSTGVITATYTNISCSDTDDILAATDTTPPLTATGTLTPPATAPGPTGNDVAMGGFTGTGFVSGQLAVATPTITPGGNTLVTVDIVNSTGGLSSEPVDVTFTSSCVDLGLATLSNTTVSVTTGTATTQFTDLGTGCVSTTVVANGVLTNTGTTATLNPATATGAVTISTSAPPPAGSLNLGSGLGNGFQNAALNILDTTVAPGGNTNIVANVVDENGLLSTASHTVDFYFYCDNQGTASLSNTSVTSSTGSFTTTFNDTSCDGNVDIYATSTLNSEVKTAYGSLTVNDTSTPITQIGRDTGGSFVANEIGIGGDTQNTDALNAGETTTLSVTIVDGAGSFVTNSTTVSFTSNCFSSGLADIYDAPGGSNSVTTTSGRATVTYQAQGCSGSDSVTATSTVGSATGTITVTPANVNSIQFIAADPAQIAIRGMSSSGVGETTTVSFRIEDTTGGAIPNHPVTFTLSNTDGGIVFGDTNTTSSTGTSDGSGNVSIVVKSGTTKASFRVLVTSDVDTNIKGQSDPILVSTGIADQDSMSLSASVLNPEAWSHDGEVSVITARASDRYNNPVPDNTVIGFIAEGGSIDSSCLTTNGACSVNWISSNPRPSLAYTSSTNLDIGQATILAFVVGEESFTDTNGNGEYDSGEPFTDMPEAFLDVDGNGTRGDGTGGTPVEIYQDYNQSSTYNGADGLFNGVLCNTGCGTQSGINARDDIVLIMSGSNANITFTSEPTGTKLQNCTISFSYTVLDDNNNIMPAGTSIRVTTTGGSITQGGTRTVSNANPTTATDIATVGYSTFNGKLKTGSTAGNGFDITVEVTTPNGDVTEVFSTGFSIDEDPPVSGGTCP